MGKKAKKKTRSLQKEGRVSSGSPRTTHRQLKTTDETEGDGVVVYERKPCTHLEKGVNLDKISSKIGSLGSLRCEDCREGAVNRSSGKGRSGHGKKKGKGPMDTKSESRSIWVCLECGHFSCGGIGLPKTSQSHAVRHARQNRHPCVIQFDNPQLCWCFSCDFLIPVGNSNDNDVQKDILLDAVKLIKGRSSAGASLDVEDVWFGGGSGGEKTMVDDTHSGVLDGSSGYRVRGLVNLGNTCFFNSVMQNLFAMDMLRDHFMKLDWSVGHMSMSLKKLFSETSLEVDSRNVINPKTFFGCICAKAPQFRGYQQQDSHELLRYLLDGLCTEESVARKLHNSSGENGSTSNLGPTFVEAIFGGQLSSAVCCVECGHSSVVYEPFLDLSLPVPMKKPPSKKAPPVSRPPRKPKLPSKKGGRICVKENTDVTPTLPQCEPEPGPSESSKSSCQVPSTVPVAEQPVASFDDFTWLDYIEPDEASNDLGFVSENNDISVTQDSEDRQVFPNVAGQTVASLDEFSSSDYIEPIKAVADCHSVSQNDNIPVIKDSENKEVFQNGMLQNSSESQSRVCSPNREPKMESHSSQGNSCEYELPLQVQSSEVLLLPYKEENSTNEDNVRKEGEASNSVVACEQDILDFDGFGDLFNEPEMVPYPNTETSLLAGNSSNSDPDEVDNTDASVSIASCLACFTKPELLSKEHAWHCESCSKILRGQRMGGKGDRQKTALKIQMNGVDVRSRNTALGLNEDSSDLTELSHLCKGKLESDTVSTATSESLVLDTERLDDSNQNCTKLENSQSLVNYSKDSQGDKSYDALNYTSQEISTTSGHYKSNCQCTKSCSVDEYNCIRCNNDQVEPGTSQSSARVCESDDNEDEELDSESVKVMRDATKRILISRAPPILTIHLKRFSQDARGRLSKLNGHVNFGDIIDLRPYMDPRCREERVKCEYRLVGVVEHSGTMRGGHYVAYVRCNKSRGNTEKLAESTWYYASDTHVHEVSLAEVLRSEAYILFYEKI